MRSRGKANAVHQDVPERSSPTHLLSTSLESQARDALRPVGGAPIVKPLAPRASKRCPQRFGPADRFETPTTARVGLPQDDRPPNLDGAPHLDEESLLISRLHIVKSVEENRRATRGKLHASEVRGFEMSLPRQSFSCDRDLSLPDVEPAQLDVAGRRSPVRGEISFLVLALGRAYRGKRERLSASEVDDAPRAWKQSLPQDLPVDGIDAELDPGEGPRPEARPGKTPGCFLEEAFLGRGVRSGGVERGWELVAHASEASLRREEDNVTLRPGGCCIRGSRPCSSFGSNACSLAATR